ncbi:CNP1-like family protein [Undibacterium flavidum]|uniref:CNP1-like family protein n=1 Tax=Undibacterium flavidum TaxID=2762297 RepID=A0ABR6YDU3_9BURK|nr:CNP1-like family protein [Undibacterium flavidum]MBC3874706.1 CNP1-like family protein [Undibacterium flavidum]
MPVHTRTIRTQSKLQQVLRHCILYACLALPTMSAIAQNADEKVVKVWVDSPIVLPAAPATENLLRFYSNENQIFFIDSKSISIAADGSLRYTLVSTSQSGAKNVSYEGMRCDTNEKRLFAFGRADGTWSNSRRNTWDEFTNKGVNQQHGTLAWDFVCEGGSIAGNIEKIIQRIRQHQSLRQYH